MLVLLRRVNQSVHINGACVVTILGVERNRVKIGITAASDVKVMREELRDRAEDQEGPAPR